MSEQGPLDEPKTTPKTNDEPVQPSPAADSISQTKPEATGAINAKESNDEGKGRKSQEPNLDAPSAQISPSNPPAVEPAPVESTDKQGGENATASKEDSQATKPHEHADLQASPEPSAEPIESKVADPVIETASEPHSAPSVDPAPPADEKHVEKTVKASKEGIQTKAETAATYQTEYKEQPKPTQEEAEPDRSTQAETAEKRDADDGDAQEESLATESKSSIKKKKKKPKKEGSKVKKSKKDGSKKGEEKTKKKKKKKSKKEDASSKETEAITDGKQSGETTTTAVTKAAARLPHSRIPGRDPTDLSYLAGVNDYRLLSRS